MTRDRAPRAGERQPSAARTVSRPDDAHEREADRAADVVARGGSVTGWSFSSVPASTPAPVQRQEVVKEKTDEEKRNEALKKTGEAILATPEGQAVKAKVLADPLVKTVTDAVKTTPGIIVTGVAAAGGVAALGATGKALPFQPPEIPLDKITPGLSAKVTYEGPVNAPTFVGLTITYKEQGPKGKGKPKPDQVAADIERLKAQQEMFRPASEKAAAKQQEDEAVAAWVASQQFPGPRPGFTIPLTPAPATKKEEPPVQRAPISATAEAPAHADVDGALATPGRALDPSTRRSMEARFGYDFSGVRIHDDQQSAAAASGIDAAAFTVGPDVVLGSGADETLTSTGRRLLAHELAHVVQSADVPKLGTRVPPAADRNVDAAARDGIGATLRFAPPIVHHVLRSQGVPLPPRTRARFKPRLDADLDAVRIHADALSAKSAESIDAIAYTVGRDIVFGQGRYAPEDPDGHRLLAHELMHVQQDPRVTAPLDAPVPIGDARDAEEATDWHPPSLIGRPVTPVLRRATGGFFSWIGGFFNTIAHLFVDYSPEQLNEYLDRLTANNDIEGDPDSDDKARAIVKAWVADARSFELGPRQKALLILEMLDGPTTEADEEAIVDLLETSVDGDVRAIFGPGGVDPGQLMGDVDNEATHDRLERFFTRRFVGGTAGVLSGDRKVRRFVSTLLPEEVERFVSRHFAGPDRALAMKVLDDLRAVKEGELDFESEDELRAEVFKRVRTSQLMQESQNSDMFDYPEALTRDCDGFDPTVPPDLTKHARVNKAAREYWSPATSGPDGYYFFNLSPLGREHAFDALRLLFTRQPTVCDRTLIHCDYLTSVIELRAFAESIGAAAFDDRVRRGAIVFALTYFGAEYVTAADQPSPVGRLVFPMSRESVSLQVVRPASEADLVIGDHVVFWNHLAYDAISMMRPGPWRLENAIMIDRNDRNEDIFEGHGAPADGSTIVPGPKDRILEELQDNYNYHAEPAEALAKRVDVGDTAAAETLKRDYPQVDRAASGWVVRELPKNSARPKKAYDLRPVKRLDDPELIGLRDEIDQSKLGPVRRPVESREKAL